MIILHLPESELHISNPITNLRETISNLTGLCVSDFYLLENGRKLASDYCSNGNIHVIPRIVGGKGGFGSMLRAIGAQIEKTTNREACRDLSGRRLRDINEEKRLKTWLSQKEEREQKAKERKRKRLERLCQGPKVEIKDEAYLRQRSDLVENMNDSIEKGFKACSSGLKRKVEETEAKSLKKPKGLLLDIEMDSDSDEVSSSDTDEASNNKSVSVAYVEPQLSLVQS